MNNYIKKNEKIASINLSYSTYPWTKKYNEKKEIYINKPEKLTYIKIDKIGNIKTWVKKWRDDKNKK